MTTMIRTVPTHSIKLTGRQWELLFGAVASMTNDDVEAMMEKLQIDIEDVYELCEAVTEAKSQMRRKAQ